MRLLRTIAVTFAQYSRIPVPKFDWGEEDMTYSMAAFPWVGAFIGLVFACVYRAGAYLEIPVFAASLLMTAVPLLLTGGFHVDGFMDVSDALSSFGSREDKLRILKDPHIGAFAVIRLAVVGLIYIASLDIALSGRDTERIVLVISVGFFLSRALSALGVLNFRSARNEGMLFYEASCAGKGRNINNALCCIFAICALALMVMADIRAGVLAVTSAVLSFGWYRYKSYKEFGGITGDTAGYFVTICETAVVFASAMGAISK